MHSVRRAALRAASSSTFLFSSPSRQQLVALPRQISRSAASPLAIIPARYFFQTSRVAQDEQNIVEQAIKSVDSSNSTLESASASQTTSGNAPAQTPGLFLSNLPFDATDEHIREAFGKYGEIVSARVARDERGLSRGFGFIEFGDKDAAGRAVAETHRSFWHGRRINVEYRKATEKKQGVRSSNAPSDPSTSIFIGNIPYESSDADLNRLFRELDNVTNVRVAVDRNTGWPKGFAHADFGDLESAAKAIEKLRSTSIGGRQLRVDYSHGKPTTQRRERESSSNSNSRGRSTF